VTREEGEAAAAVGTELRPLPCSSPWSSYAGGRDELALLAGGGGHGRSRPGSGRNRRRRLGFWGTVYGAGLSTGEEDKERRSACPSLLSTVQGGAGNVGHPVPGDGAPVATRVRLAREGRNET
jgi:hypothetical protein